MTIYIEIIFLTVILAPIFFYAKAFFNKIMLKYQLTRIQNQHILYVIAHPDDEAMFFVPSIVELRKKNFLYLLCISNGNADGLGKKREKELAASCKYLGFQESECLDHQDLQDGMDKKWDVEIVAE